MADKAVHVVNPDHRDDNLYRLAAVGIDAKAARQHGQLELRTNTETYFREGQGEFPLSRIVCGKDWVAEGQPYVDDVVAFGSRVNDVWLRHDDAVTCSYYLAKFGGETVIDIVRTHPMVIVGGILHQNPFFVLPENFLSEFRERRARRAESSSTKV